METKSAAALFLPLYAVVAYYFANRMVRLIIFLGPIASCLSGVAVGHLLEQVAGNLAWFAAGALEDEDDADEKKTKKKPASKGGKGGKGGSLGKGGKGGSSSASETAALVDAIDANVVKPLRRLWNGKPARFARVAAALALLALGSTRVASFWSYSHDIARGMSQPSVMFKGQLNDGRTIIVKDYVEAYHWLRDNTPEDARVMAWWDYGYRLRASPTAPPSPTATPGTTSTSPTWRAR